MWYDHEPNTADETATEQNNREHKAIRVSHLEETEVSDTIGDFDQTSGATDLPGLKVPKRKVVIKRHASNLSQSESSEVQGYTSSRKIPKKRPSVMKGPHVGSYSTLPRNFDPAQAYSQSRNEFLGNQGKTV